MKKLLFVNACIRENSRTEELSKRYLDKYKDEYQIEELKVSELDIKPFDVSMLKQRDSDAAENKLDSVRYQLAYQFADADMIVVSAPYWDCLFPAILRVYFEHICVTDVTFAYGEFGSLVKKCNANKLVYITTCGGFLPEHSAVESLIREMGTLFSIEDVCVYHADGLDIFTDKVQEILNSTLEKMN